MSPFLPRSIGDETVIPMMESSTLPHEVGGGLLLMKSWTEDTNALTLAIGVANDAQSDFLFPLLRLVSFLLRSKFPVPV